jgi:hypothetical protein
MRAWRWLGVAAVAVPVGAAGLAYHRIPGCYFFADDFFDFLQVADAGTYHFVLSPMAGHVLLARNAIQALYWHVFGLDAAPYFWSVLLTHLLNVWLLFRLVRAVTGRLDAAAAAATLWGVSPLHVEPLAWYAVYGQVLTATVALAILADAATLGDRPLGTGRLLAWGGLLLVGSTCFGTGLGIAVATPVALLVALPRVWTRPRTVVLLGTIPIAAVVFYLGLRAFARSQGEGSLVNDALVAIALGSVRPVPGMLLHLVRFSVLHLVAGPMMAPGADPVTASWPVLGLVGAGVVGVLATARGACRRWTLAVLLLVGGVYGAIAFGRANFSSLLGHGLVQPAETLRYHYAGSAMVAAVLGIVLGAARRGAPVLLSRAICLAVVVLQPVALVRAPLPIDTHADVRTTVAREVGRVDAALAVAPPDVPPRLPNTSLPPRVVGIFGQMQIPGIAALLVLFRPPDQLEDRGVRFLEPDPGVRATFVPPRSRRLSRLLEAPRVRPGGDQPNETSPPCEFVLARELVLFGRAVVSCTLVTSSMDAAAACADAAERRAAARVAPAGVPPCRACADVRRQLAALRRAIADGRALLLYLPPVPEVKRLDSVTSWQCRRSGAHAVVRFATALIACQRRSAVRTGLLDDPDCAARARATYLDAAGRLDPACPPSVPVVLAQATSRVTAHAVAALFCLDW